MRTLPSEVSSENEVFLYALASCLSCHDDVMKRYVGVGVTLVSLVSILKLKKHGLKKLFLSPPPSFKYFIIVTENGLIFDTRNSPTSTQQQREPGERKGRC